VCTSASGELEGTVTSGGVLVEGAQVVVYGEETATNAAGYYHFPYIASGEQTITVSKAGYHPAVVTATIMADVVNVVDIELIPLQRATVSGVVKTSGGYPVSGATVTLIGSETHTDITDANGAFEIENVNDATGYTFTVTAADCSNYSATVDVEGDTDLGDIIMTCGVTYTVNITTNTGASPSGASVTLTNTAGGTPVMLESTATGVVVFDNVALGNYSIDITLEGFQNYTANDNITFTNRTHNALLVVILEDPKNLVLNSIPGDPCNTALFTWDNIELATYTVYLDGVFHANVTEPRFLFTKDNVTEDRLYTSVGVSASYPTGESNVITLTQSFKIECRHSIKGYELDYGIYPNPATHSLTIDRGVFTPATIELYNAMGMRISQYETSDAKFDINVASLATGTYFVRVIEGDRVGVKSFVKK
jgi:hypothetical protein